MKTLKELYGEVMASDALKKEYFAAANDGKIDEFLSSHGCDATGEQLGEFMKDPANLPQGELGDDELDSVAGGTCYKEGRPVVTIMNDCEYWACERCGGTATGETPIRGHGKNKTYNACLNCGMSVYCINCKYCRYESALWQCYNPKRHNN